MNRLKNSKGFTLVESIVSLITVTIITALLFTLITLVKNTYIELQKSSEGQVLSAIITNIVQDELRYATDVNIIDSSTKEFTYTSQSTNATSCTLVSYDPNTKKENDGKAGDYKIYIRTGTGNYNQITGNGIYVFGLKADIDTKYIAESGKDSYFEVKLRIYDDKKDIITTEFIVKPLNKHKV